MPTEAPGATPIEQRAPHCATVRLSDLDALRAFSMLLGIALHAALAFAPIPWIAMNGETSPALIPFIEIVHAFRLPLFFVMSGFFSAMLVQRRGIGGYLTQRWKRIALPLLLAMITIVPATWGVIAGGAALNAATPAPERVRTTPVDDSGGIWQAAAAGDLPTVQRLSQAGAPIDDPDPRFSTVPLAWAATGDHADVVAYLLDAGADPNRRMIDDNIPLHTACFFGASESATLLRDAGADTSARNGHGESPVDAMRHDRGTVEFIAGLLGVSVDFDHVEAGRREIARSLSSSNPTALDPVRTLLRRVFSADLFLHLWFLWHLCWLAIGLACVTLIARAVGWTSVPRRVIATPACLIALVPFTALTQSWQTGFGPDTSATLLPDPHVLAHYAVFFAFGALMFNGKNASDRLGRVWWIYLPIAVVSCVLALRLSHDPRAFVGQGIDTGAAERLTPLLQSIFVWTTIFALIGVARVTLSRPIASVRYVSDASYWLYLAHFPLVVAGQFALSYLPIPPIVEFAFLTIAATGALMLSYRFLERPSWIGRLLNGPRERHSDLSAAQAKNNTSPGVTEAREQIPPTGLEPVTR